MFVFVLAYSDFMRVYPAGLARERRPSWDYVVPKKTLLWFMRRRSCQALRIISVYATPGVMHEGLINATILLRCRICLAKYFLGLRPSIPSLANRSIKPLPFSVAPWLKLLLSSLKINKLPNFAPLVPCCPGDVCLHFETCFYIILQDFLAFAEIVSRAQGSFSSNWNRKFGLATTETYFVLHEPKT